MQKPEGGLEMEGAREKERAERKAGSKEKHKRESAWGSTYRCQKARLAHVVFPGSEPGHCNRAPLSGLHSRAAGAKALTSCAKEGEAVGHPATAPAAHVLLAKVGDARGLLCNGRLIDTTTSPDELNLADCVSLSCPVLPFPTSAQRLRLRQSNHHQLD